MPPYLGPPSGVGTVVAVAWGAAVAPEAGADGVAVGSSELPHAPSASTRVAIPRRATTDFSLPDAITYLLILLPETGLHFSNESQPRVASIVPWQAFQGWRV